MGAKIAQAAAVDAASLAAEEGGGFRCTQVRDGVRCSKVCATAGGLRKHIGANKCKFGHGTNATMFLVQRASRAGGILAAGSRPNKLTRRCPNVVPSGSRSAATDDARCRGKLKKPGNRPAINIAGKPALRDELLRLYAIGQGQSTEDKLSAKQAHTVLKNKKAHSYYILHVPLCF